MATKKLANRNKFVSVRIDDATMKLLRQQADLHTRTLTSQIYVYVKDGIAKELKQK